MEKYVSDNQFMRYSRITGKTYNIFDCIKILNLSQAASYVENGVLPVDVQSSKDKKTGRPILVFVFRRDDTKEVYDLWCNHKLGKDDGDAI